VPRLFSPGSGLRVCGFEIGPLAWIALEDSVIPAPWYSARVVLSAHPARPAGGARLDSWSVECQPGLARVGPSVGSFVGHGPGPLTVGPDRRPGLGYCWIPGGPLSSLRTGRQSPWFTARQCPAGSKAVSTRWRTGRQSPSGSQAVSPRLALRPLVPLGHTGRQYPGLTGRQFPTVLGPSAHVSCAVVHACEFR
jgi:hypothetical protein